MSTEKRLRVKLAKQRKKINWLERAMRKQTELLNRIAKSHHEVDLSHRAVLGIIAALAAGSDGELTFSTMAFDMLITGDITIQTMRNEDGTTTITVGE